MLEQTFISKFLPPENISSPVYGFVFYQSQLLLYKNAITEFSSCREIKRLNIKILSQHYLGVYKNKPCFCLDIHLEAVKSLPAYFTLQTLRYAGLASLNQDFFLLAGRALQIIQWHNNTKFCARCAASLIISKTERAKICEACCLNYYPRISPCIIVLIKRGEEILLARSPHFTPNMYSLSAGFIEAGESAECAVKREVREETGIEIKNIRYHFSQPWPFPDSLMLGFSADYKCGEILIDGVEIEKAGWFNKKNLPQLPNSLSIARKLIDNFMQGKIK